MSLKTARILPFKSQHNVCTSISPARTFAPMESIKERREQMGLKQRELAQMCGVHLSTISHIEHLRVTPSLPLFVKLSEGLQVSPKRLLTMLKLDVVIDIQKVRQRRKR